MNNPGTRVMVISDLSEMQVRCKVDEADAPLVAAGQIARVYLQSDTRRSISGSILRVGTKGTKPIGRDVVTFETLVLIAQNDPRVKPGMTANVEIEVARKDEALTVPVQAVVYRKRRDLPEELVAQYDQKQTEQNPTEQPHLAEYIRLVFCVEDGKVQPHLVETGINDAAGVEIVEGIALTDTIVIGPYRSLDQLKAGSTVKLAEKPTTDVTEETEQDADEDDATAVAASDADTETTPESENN
jgi:HlyD family secretion protein